METGTLKWFDETRGFGFIAPDRGGKDIFVHIKDIDREQVPLPGDRMQFEHGEDRNGRAAATNVSPIPASRSAA